MRRTKGRMALCLILIALLLIFIWGNSLLPGELSGAFSRWVQDLLYRLFGQLPGGSQTGHGLLRKLAHFTEFTCLGLSLFWLFSMLKKKFWIPLFCGFLVACTDETIQCFVPDRGPAIKDVVIDTCGVCLGVGLLLAVFTIYQKIIKFWRKQNYEEADCSAAGSGPGYGPGGLRQHHSRDPRRTRDY